MSNNILLKTINVSELLNFEPFDNDYLECFELDIVSILIDIFINVESRNILNHDKFLKAKHYLFNLNPDLLKNVEDKRFHPFCALFWHEPTNMTVAQFRKKIKNYLGNYFFENYVLILEEDLQDIHDDNISTYVQSFCYDFAKETVPKLFSAWKNINFLQGNHPENNETVECTII